MFQNDLVAMKYIVLNVKHNFQHKKDVNFFFYILCIQMFTSHDSKHFN